ncbi:hypothetical protein LTR97_005527 [Elasticomyces elasticus]|uniref:N-acetyltransferase domain-containing protein n=1 Tax=Elasticomyces elasticus TaxID=574655 RepID=A0AAN7WKZ6_9PEZI|nr:hypothetical protein LTR97_005527 [Elasticomyces elasticus]
MEELAILQYECFPPAIRKTFMGCSTPLQADEITRIAKHYAEGMRDDPNDIWMGVKDAQTGRFIAGANWKLHVNGEGGKRSAEDAPAWLEGEELENSKKIIAQFASTRQRIMPGAFIRLMLRWGCDVADLLFIPGYIEASIEGNFLYKTYGFVDHEVIESDLGEEGMAMTRAANSKPLSGGKAAPPS